MDFNLLHYYFDHFLVHYPHLNKKLYVLKFEYTKKQSLNHSVFLFTHWLSISTMFLSSFSISAAGPPFFKSLFITLIELY